MPRILFLDGRFGAENELRISVSDRGFLYGDAVFETIRTYRGEPHALREHVERLRHGARVLGFTVPRVAGGWRRLVGELLARNRRSDADLAVRITVTRGVGGESLLPPGRPRPTILAGIRDLDPRLPSLRQRGADVAIVPFEPERAAPLAGVKTTAYAAAIMAKRAASAAGAFEALYSDGRGRLSEGATSNLFLARRGRLETPVLERGGLPGITRGTVIDLARDAGIPVVERAIRREDLLSAEEAFLTATTIEVLPIRSIDGVTLRAAPGPLTVRMRSLYCGSHGAADCHETDSSSGGVRISASPCENRHIRRGGSRPRRRR